MTILTGDEILQVTGVTSLGRPSGVTFTTTTNDIANIGNGSPLNGTEVMLVRGQKPNGEPAASSFITTTGNIAALVTGSASPLTGSETLELTYVVNRHPSETTFIATTQDIANIRPFSITLNSSGVTGAFGNSFSSQWYNTVTSTSLDRRSTGAGTIIDFLMNQNVRHVFAGDFGVSGDTLAGMIPRAPTAIAYNPDIWILEDITANDIGNASRTAAQINADLNTLVALFAATGKPILILNSTPRSNWNSLTASQIAVQVQVQQAVRAHIMTYPLTYNNVIIFDVWNETVNPTSPLNAPLPNLYYDGLHPSQTVSNLMALKIKDIYDRILILNFSTALPSTAGCKNTNPTMAGSNSISASGVSGFVANHVSVSRVLGSSVTAVCSKSTATIGGNLQTTQHVIIGGATAASEEVDVILESPEITLGFTGGTDSFYAITRIKVTGSKGVLGIFLSPIIDMATGTDPTARDMANVTGIGQYWPDGDSEGTLQTEPLAVPVGTQNRDRLLLRIQVDGTIAGNGCAIDVGQTEYRAI